MLVQLAFASVKTPWAYGLIAIIAADFDLFTDGHALALSIQAHVHGGFAATAANGFHFLQIIRQREQCFGTGKRLALEVAAKAITNHGRARGVGQLVQLNNLRVGHELRFVDQNARGKRACLVEFGEVRRAGKKLRRALHTEARDNFSSAITVINRGGKEIYRLPALFIVVRHLLQRGGFAGVHRRETKIELGQTHPQKVTQTQGRQYNGGPSK